METKFNFNSAICTSRSQSERLLALGLKKETADMYYQKLNDKWTPFVGQPFSYDGLSGTYLIPAWSLSRLINIIQEDCPRLDIIKNVVWIKSVRFNADNIYDNLISAYEWLIKEGHFNKEYLA